MQSDFDLNLLVALDALLTEGSVSGAAARLHLSAAATSRTLTRIRKAFGDPILVRAGRAMVPTPRALALQPEVQRLIGEARQLVAAAAVDMASVRRTFTVLANDSQVSFLGRALLDRCRTEAPGIQLRFLAEGSGDYPTLRDPQVDVEVNVLKEQPPDVHVEPFMTDRLVGVVRPGHPLLQGRASPERFAAAEHVISSRRGLLSGPIDRQLAAAGLHRRIVATAPTNTAALLMIEGTDLVGMIPERMSRTAVEALGLRSFELPFAPLVVAISFAWHRRYDADQAHRWLRNVIRDVGRLPPDA
jgi:DNA-binding transcriptional LysR family regulator